MLLLGCLPFLVCDIDFVSSFRLFLKYPHLFNRILYILMLTHIKLLTGNKVRDGENLRGIETVVLFHDICNILKSFSFINV